MNVYKYIRSISSGIFGLMLFFGVSCQVHEQVQEISLTKYVNPYIGSGEHGHVFVGANVPYGFVQLGPTQFSEGWDWCSGYHYSDSTIIGFGHQHLSGTGIGDLGDISLMPVIGEVKTTRGTLPNQESGIYSYFSRDNEFVAPGYYSVLLDRFNIGVELTASNRVGFNKYSFPETDDARVIIDLEHGIGWDTPVEGYITQINDTTIAGYRKSSGWAKRQEVYFTAVFSKPMYSFIVSDSTVKKESNSLVARRVYGQAIFNMPKDEELLVKVALSPVSIDNAAENMRHEIPGWDFDKAVADADGTWNRELNRVLIETNDEITKEVFYTSLYHTMFFPAISHDVNGDYRGADGKVHNDASFTNMTVLSLWDTYRAAFPLISITNPELSKNLAGTMLNIYKQQGKLPVWHLMGNETDIMVGNPGVCIMADFLLKGVEMDRDLAYEAMKVSSMLDDRGMKQLKEYGYIPFDKDNTYETVAKGLEFAISDWSVSQVAKLFGNDDDYNYFLNRSKSYKHYFDHNTNFMRGISSEGAFREPFNPFRSVHMRDDYTEGNAWQYTWLVPHDVDGLVDLFGGKEPFIEKLDSLFVVEGDIGDESNDITGLIGQYAHGNEPSHHVVYLYSMLGQRWKTADKVREINSSFYTNKPEGICGNEDVGQMSAWYIMSALGFYQVKPAGGEYVLGSPIIDKATINIDNDTQFTIIVKNNSPQNKYIQSVKLNGAGYDMSHINHSDIVKGGTLEIEMGSNPM